MVADVATARAKTSASTFMASGLVSIGGDPDDDQRADDDLLHVIRPAHLLASVAEEGHDQRADHRAGDAPFAAIEAPAADHDRGDDVELHAHRHRRIAMVV